MPLSALALAQLPPRREGYPHLFGRFAGRGFSGWSKAKALLDAQLDGMPHWTLHDLRRSFVTHMAERGLAEPHIIEAVVNHISGHKAGVAGTYNRALYAAAEAGGAGGVVGRAGAHLLPSAAKGACGAQAAPLTPSWVPFPASASLAFLRGFGGASAASDAKPPWGRGGS